MLESRIWTVVLLLFLALGGWACIDNPDDPDEREFGRICKWDVTDAESGAVVERWTYAYARSGHMIWEEVDYGGNGKIDHRIDYYLDERGRLERQEIDEDGNGDYDWKLEHHYDSRGLKSYIDESNGEGEPTQRQHFSHDQRDRLWHRDDDFGVDGVVDARTTWFYDGDDNAIRVELDHGPDGRANQIVGQEYELIADLFRLVRRQGDWDGDGIWDYEQRVMWSDDGLLVGREIDEDGDGVVNERWRYFYDSAGSRTSGDGDTNGDGTWDTRQRYSTECSVWRDPDR